jgi:hypothetical protein
MGLREHINYVDYPSGVPGMDQVRLHEAQKLRDCKKKSELDVYFGPYLDWQSIRKERCAFAQTLQNLEIFRSAEKVAQLTGQSRRHCTHSYTVLSCIGINRLTFGIFEQLEKRRAEQNPR